ncbi:MAG TPA: phospholipid scramblase-related protein, partial [Dermatophilaceae bacterium]
GDEIARITKTWAGLAKEMFTKGDNYVVQIHRPLEEPLRSLVIASALAVDTALRQASPGWRQASSGRRQGSSGWFGEGYSE